MTMQNCDVLLAVGARFDDRVIGNPKHFASVERKIIHIDIDPSSISKRVKVDIPIVGDVKDVLQRADRAAPRGARPSPTPRRSRPWWAQINEWRKQRLPGATTARARDVIKPQHVVETLWELTKDRDDLHHLRRRPAPDVGGAVLPLRASRAAGSTPAAWARWASACRMRWASSSPSPTPRCLHHRRRLDPDVHPGALDLPAVQDAGQDRLAEQPLPRHGAAVAADRLRRPLLAQLHGRAARLRQARRGLRPRRHAHRQARRRRAGAARGAAR